jgi:hypothetical protein
MTTKANSTQMTKCNNIEVWIAIWRDNRGHKYSRKIRFDPDLTERYQRHRFSPPIGYVLGSGEVVIDKSSDEKRILLFIDNTNYPKRVRKTKKL